jgi:hypothetical protein
MGKTITFWNVKHRAMTGTVYADTPSYFDAHIRVLTTDVVFKLSNGKYLHIAKGFEWDEQSVPWGLQWAFPKSGKYAVSALVHDALYYARYRSQKFADAEFKLWMDETINRNQSWLRWAFVSLFGGIYWNKNIRKPSDRLLWNQQHIEIIDNA